MLNIFGRKKSTKVEVQSPIKKINEAALALIASANEGNRGTRLVTNGAALEIVRRSLVKTDGQPFSVQKVHALKEVSEYISLTQRNKVVTASAAHFDLLPIGHPSAKRDHRLSREDLLRARARWFADDSLVVDDNVQSLLATAFIADPESPEHQYAVARLTAMGAHRVPVEALVAAALGFNDGANRGFWRQQIRDRKGRFAKMGGTIKTLLRRGGQVYPQYTSVVSTNSNNGTVRSMQPDGRLIESPATSIDTDVVALIPGTEQPDGVGTSPARFDSTDPVVEEANLNYVNEPNGFLPKGAPSSPRGLDPQNFDRVWEDDLGNYQVIRGNFRDGEGQDYVVSRLEKGEVVPIGVGKNWAEVVDIVGNDEPKFQKGDDAEPNIPEGFDIGPSTREEIDPENLTPDELAAGYGFTKNQDGSYTADGRDGAIDIEQLPNGQWNLTQRTDDEGGIAELGSFDSPAEAFENAQVAGGTPEFDPGQVVDFRNDQGPDEAPEPEAPESPEPGGLYEVDRGPYAPQGPQEGVESENYTDDPVELAQNYDPEELEGALEEAVRNGSGEALIPFDEGDEYVPAEALYNALKEQDRDPDRLLDDIYDGVEPSPEIEEAAPDLEEDEDQGPITPEQIAEMRGEANLPALLDALSDEELAEVFNNEDYSAYLPENEEFNAPEGKYELDPEPFGANEEFAPEDAPEGAPTAAADLAMDMSSEDLEQLLRDAVNGEYGRPGYGRINMPDADGEDFEYDVPAEAIRDALQLQGIDTNEILREAYDGGEMEPNEIDDAVEGEGLETEEVFGLSQEDKDKLIAATKEGGYTVDFVTGEVPTDGYMVASEADVPDGEGGLRKREEVVSFEDFEADPQKYLDEFIARNVDKLKEDGYYIGTWTSTITDEETGEEKDYVFFDVSERIEDKEAALQAARDRNEIAIFGVEEFEEFFTDPEREAQKNAGQEAPEGDDAAPEELPGDDGAGTPGVDQAGQPVDSGEPEEQEEVGPLGRVYDISGWEKVGGQTGSNEGGLYRDADGNEYYVKFPPQKQLRNELLASALYEKIGVPVGRVYLGRDADGNEVLVSPMLENPEPLRDNLDNPDAIEGARLNFAADAWLNNWDSVGLVFDNMVMADSELLGRELYRIDAGGALLFRAQGADKDLPEDVQLIDSLRNPDVNQQAATVYGDMTDEEIKFSVQRMLLGATDENIDELVDAAFPDDAETSNLLKDRLKSRRDYLIERFKPVTPEMAEQAAEGAARDYAEQLQEAQGKVDAAFADNPLVLDFDGDIEAQINDALANERDLVFSYNGVDRIVRPVSIETNENTGNTNISAVDGDGNFKKFTISKMSVASNSDDTVDDVVGDDPAGDEIETSDSELPQSLEEWEQELLKVVDEMYSTENLTSQDVEDLGEQPDVNDDITSEIVNGIDSYTPGEFPETPQQKAAADLLNSYFNPQDGSEPITLDSVLDSVSDPDNSEPDIIWQRVQDEYEGNVLPNGHVVVSSTMHGDRRYDVVVRRANNNTFHIYHRVTYPDGSTKIKEMGGQGWHSAEALFSRVETQIFNSKSRPKTTVNKGLKQENGNTLYADTSTPTQPGSYVAADGSVVKKGDRVTVVNPTHSKFGMGARIVSVKRKYSSDGKKYTDYLRVRYDDGTKNNIVSTSVTPEGTSPAFPQADSSEANQNQEALTINNPEDTLSAFGIGQPITYEQANNLPKGAVVATESGKLIRKGGAGVWVEHMSAMNMPFFFASDSQAWFQSYDPNYKKGESPSNALPVIKQPGAGGAPVLPSLPPGDTGESDDDDKVSAAFGAPSSGKEYNKSEIQTGEKPKVYDDDSANTGIMQSHLQTFGSGQAFGVEYAGAGNVAEMEEYYRAAFKPTDGTTISDSEIPELPVDTNGQKLAPGAIVNVGLGYSTFAIVTEIRAQKFPGDGKPGTIDIVIISGPQRGSEWVGVNADEVSGNSTFISTDDAKNSFNITINQDFRNTLRNGKKALLSPSIYQDEDMVVGPGFDAPELDNLPAWNAGVAGTKTVEEILADLRNSEFTGSTGEFVAKLREAGDGYYALIDAASIEDGQVRFQRVVNSNGEVQIRLTGKLTHWAGNDLQSKFSQEGAAVDEGIRLDEYVSDADGNLVAQGKTPLSKVDVASLGATYRGQYGNANINFFRALSQKEDDSLIGEEKRVSFYEDPRYARNPVTFHNLFDIRLPENATQEDIENALRAAGVSDARPATDLDVQNLAENKLLWLFGNLTDGTRNPSNVLRQQELQKIEKQWGVKASDITVETDGTAQQRPMLLLPQSVADKIAKDTGLDVVNHSLSADADEEKTAQLVATILSSGRLESTLGRHLSGNFTAGKSSWEDVNGPGAHYTFLYMNKEFAQDSNGVNYSVNMVLDASTLFRRFDFYANKGDGWGALQGPNADSFNQISARNSNAELLFKNNIALTQSLKGVGMTPGVRQRVLEILRERGITNLGTSSIEEILGHDIDQYK